VGVGGRFRQLPAILTYELFFMQTQLAEIAAAGECSGKLLFEERFSARISTDGRTADCITPFVC